MEIISVNITKGGCGKTTTVEVLSEILGKFHDKKILCVDADPQCNLTTVSGIDLMECQDHNLYTLLKGTSTLEQCIKHSTYYDIVPGSLLLAYADTEFNLLGREFLLKERLENADYDIVFIDTPPSLGLMTIMSMTCSTRIIIPTECSYLSMIGIDQLCTTISSVRKHSNTGLIISGILLIKYSQRNNLDTAVLNGLEKMATHMNTSVYQTKIRETVKVKEAQSLKQPIIDIAPNCTAVKDYFSFAEDFISTLK